MSLYCDEDDFKVAQGEKERGFDLKGCGELLKFTNPASRSQSLCDPPDPLYWSQYLSLPCVDGALSVETCEGRSPGSRVPVGGLGAGGDATVLYDPAL